MILPKQLAELVVFAGCARLEFAQGQSVVNLEIGCTVAQLLNLEVVGNRADFDAHIVDPVRIHTAANDVVGSVVVGPSDSKTTLKEVVAVLVVQRVLQQCYSTLEKMRLCRMLVVQWRKILVNPRRKHFGFQRRETLSPPTSK